MRPLLTSLLLFAPLLLSPLAQASAPVADGDSLEDLLRRARAQRGSEQAEMLGTVQAVVTEFETLSARNREREASRRRKRLLDLGPGVAPLLLPYLDPGQDPPEGVVYRTRQIVKVLRQLASSAITDQLIERTAVGTSDGRLNALAVLETCPEPARAAPAVRDLYLVATGRLRTGAMLTLARLGGPEAEGILSAALEDPDAEVVDLALHALAEVPSPAVAAKVLELCRAEGGSKHVLAIGSFYYAQPDLLDDLDIFVALMELLARGDADRDDAVRVLGLLTELNLDLRSKAKKAMEALTVHPNEELRNAALVLLARAGDKGARRDLLRPYNEEVAKRRDFDIVYTMRGDAWYDIGEYSEAIRDYKQAIKLMRARSKGEDPFFGLARCYARMGKFKEAKAQLDVAPVSISRLRELSSDPAFEEMLESKYASAFHLPEDD